MYSLDINFLKDRQVETKRERRSGPVTPGDKRPLIIGGLLATLLPALAGGAWWWFSTQNAQLEQRSAELDTQLGTLEAEKKRVADIEAQVKQIRDENNALATVFGGIKPWSALTQDLRDRTPPNVRISEVKQLPVAPVQPGASPSPAASAGPVQGLIEISGRASTFNDVNDFLLLLQRSPFVDPKETRLISSEKRPDQDLQSLGLDKVPQAALPSALKPKIPGSVDYKIQVGLTKASSAELIGELERKGAVGLVTRIEQLKEKGVLPR